MTAVSRSTLFWQDRARSQVQLTSAYTAFVKTQNVMAPSELIGRPISLITKSSARPIGLKELQPFEDGIPIAMTGDSWTGTVCTELCDLCLVVVAGLAKEDGLALAGEDKLALAGEDKPALAGEVTTALAVEVNEVSRLACAEGAAFSLVAAAEAVPALATAPLPATGAFCSRGPSITAMVFPSADSSHS